MAIAKLDCDTIGDLDNGIARGIINEAILQAVRDFEDRGHDSKPRVVNINLTLQRVNGMAMIDVQAVAKLPAQRSNTTQVKVAQTQAGKKGVQPTLIFQELAPDNPEQSTIDEHMGRDE